jgi:hypothetical protein
MDLGPDNRPVTCCFGVTLSAVALEPNLGTSWKADLGPGWVPTLGTAKVVARVLFVSPVLPTLVNPLAII